VKPKVLSEQALIGQRGVILIERIVLAMGSRWVPSPVLDVGIDGVIELADPTSHAALGIMLHVQSRATVDWRRHALEAFAPALHGVLVSHYATASLVL
jgi:hypothetical protein